MQVVQTWINYKISGFTHDEELLELIILTYGNYQIVAGNCVNGEAPEVHKSSDVCQSEADTGQDERRAAEAAHEDKCGDKHTENPESHVPIDLQ